MSIDLNPEPIVRAINLLQSDALRYRLAWMSARARAVAYADEIDEARAELHELRRAYLEACQSLQVLRGDLP